MGIRTPVMVGAALGAVTYINNALPEMGYIMAGAGALGLTLYLDEEIHDFVLGVINSLTFFSAVTRRLLADEIHEFGFGVISLLSTLFAGQCSDATRRLIVREPISPEMLLTIAVLTMIGSKILTAVVRPAR